MRELAPQNLPITKETLTKETLTKENEDFIHLQKQLDFEHEVQEQRDNWNS